MDREYTSDRFSPEPFMLERIIGIAMRSETTARALLDMEWITDGVSGSETRFIRVLNGIATWSATVAESVIALPWVADGVSDNERWVIDRLSSIAESSVAVAKSVIALPWLADGVSDNERWVIGRLSPIAESSVAVSESVIALPWLADGVSDSERSAVLYLSRMDADISARLMNMPFLQTPDAADVAALRSLSGLTAAQLADMLSRPMLKDGITDDEAPIVSMLYDTLDRAPSRVDKLLDPDSTTVERRTVELPLAGEVDLVIVRTRPGVRRSMDLLENAVREVESLIGEPLPTRYVGLLYDMALFDDKDDDSSFAGIHAGSYIAIRSEFDVDDGGSDADFPPYLIAHEVAHYYWAGSAAWINEGMANTMAEAIENRRVGRPLYNLTDVDCRFAALLRTLGEGAFWEGVRKLYSASGGADISIEDIRQAFGADADDVIARWRGIPKWC